MLLKILKKDFFRNKVIAIALFIFIMISSLLVSSGTNVITELFGSIDNLFDKAKIPHFVQMHSGDIDESKINTFVSENDLIEDHQIVEMIAVDGRDIFFKDILTTDDNSVMDNYFIKQNNSFDLLLNLKNEVIEVSKGEIAVPIYFMEQKNLKVGDSIKISDGSFEKVFTITDFVRDAQMNPSIVTSKRYVINEEDFDFLIQKIDKVDYLIEFQLNDLNNIGKFTNDYLSSDLPQRGPTIDHSLFVTLNAITTGIVAAVIFLVSILLIIIALLCLRFIILTTMEEDFKEIGVMKAIGITQKDIRKIYLIKYIAMTSLACISGYLLSLIVSKLFTSNISLYLGTASKNIIQIIIPFLTTVILFFVVILFCIIVLRRFKKITAVEALRSGTMGTTRVNTKLFTLRKSRLLNTNIFLGIKDVFGRTKMYLLLLTIFVICSFIIIVPINFLNTIQSPSFISYMGVGRSDIRIDIQQSNNTMQEFTDMVDYIKEDEDIEKLSPHITCRYEVLNDEGVYENMDIETGDFSIFPLKYLKGTVPKVDNEIALSLLNADGLGKEVGDTLILIVNGEEKEMLVSGIYQDITNGGKTAKALLPHNPETVIRYTINVDVKEDVSISNKITEYSKNFPDAKVTYIEDYLSQTFGTNIKQLQLITTLAIVIAGLIAILITSLFLKMLIAKDTSQIAIMRSLGFTFGKIQVQYIVRTLLVLGIGIIVGTIFSNTIGQGLVSILMSFMGASKIEFVINPIVSYLLCPFILILIVTITTLICTLSIKKIDVTKMISE
ncbi:FtsX-like permease family protein [Mycoplasmatota bacterium]|nr:FtsX-like permease family protein [Mycoplasmatota bacterium]